MNQPSFSSFSQPESKGMSEQLLLNRITNRIRNSLDLLEILSTTVAEVRDYLATDRVEIYQFLPDDHGWVIAEALNVDHLPPLKGLHFPVDDIPPYTRELMLRQRQRTIVDIDQKSVVTSQLDSRKSSSAWVYTDPVTSEIDPCHLEYLLAMGVQSSVVVPIVLEPSETVTQEESREPQNGKLWGLLVSHNARPRRVSTEELDFIQQVVDQVSVAISQSVLLDKVREQARLEAELNRVTALLYTPAQVRLQQALNETVAVYNGSGGRLYLFGVDHQQQSTVYEVGSQPTLLPCDEGQPRPVEEHQIWQRYLTSTINGTAEVEQQEPWSIAWMKTTYGQAPVSEAVGDSPKSWAIADLYKEPLLRSVSPHFQETDVRGLLICPLRYGGRLIGCLTIFRDAVEQDITWAGYHNPDERQLAPRQSFDAWQQLRKGQAQEWTPVEQRLIHSLGERFSVAVKQYQLNQQVQALNSNLERQVRIRTVELEHSTVIANQQRTLADILAKLQKPLEMQDLFRTATKEMQHLLQVDRVAVYRFDQDWGGEFVDEFGTVSVGWKKIVLATRKTWNDSHMQETKGSQYRDGKVSVVHDVYNSGLSPCHIEALEHYCVQAYMIAPLFVDQKLWGLLGAYQHERARTWEDSEVAFISQLATHLGVALQQSQSVEKVKLQASELAAVAQQQSILNTVIKKIRDSLDLTTIFATTTSELRRLLGVDRVAVFNFLPSRNFEAGKVVAEDVDSLYPSALDKVIEEPCFFDDKYKNQKINEGIYFINDIGETEVEACYREMLKEFEIKANLVAPLFDGDHLWGLLCIHQCSGPRLWSNKEKDLTRQIANQLGVAIQQAKFLSEAEAARESADFASQAKSHFLATMSHELRTPLNAILGMAQLLKRDTSLTENQCQRLNVIGKSGEHLLSLINGVLEMSRIEAGEAQLEESVVQITAFLNTLEDMLENAAISKNVDLKFDLANDLPSYVLVDEGKLRQVLINLLGNALKFTEQGSVTLKASVRYGAAAGVDPESQNLTLDFSVQDTGPGIASEDLGSIFEAFAQTQAGLDSHEGTGLGLSICRQFVELMGGTVSVESEVGVGSIFRFSIQVSFASQLQSESTASARKVVGLAADQPSPKILVVEDKAANRLLMVDLLVSLGFEVKEAVNGEEAIQLWQDWSPELIWMDMRMPVMDGYTATRKIKALAQDMAQDDAPVIVALTANAFEEDQKIALEAGCDDFVRKPFQEQKLLDTLAKHLGVHYRYEDKLGTAAEQLSDSVSMATQIALASVVEAESAAPLENAPAALNILVAEDEPSNQQLMQEMLNYFGHQACTVSNGAEAVAACEAVSYDLLMLDFQMPGLTGPEAALQIRANYDAQHQPFIVGVTGSSIAEGSEEFRKSGMDQILQKPISLDLLESFLRDLPQKRALARQSAQLSQAEEASGSGTEAKVGEAVTDSTSLSPVATRQKTKLSPAVLDRQYFFNTCHELYGDEAPQKIVERIEVFLQVWPEHLAELKAAIATQDHEAVFQLAHHFKSFVGNQGGKDLSEVCQLFEKDARSSEQPDYRDLETRLGYESQRLELALNLELERYRRLMDEADSKSAQRSSPESVAT